MSGPLSHIRVLDLSRVLAGPWAGQNLADLGAEVIKVERPKAGDDSRAFGPPWMKDAAGRDTTESAYFMSANRGKKSITVNLTHPEGQRIVRELATRCDVLIENYKVGDLDRYGLGYKDLSALNPRLVYCSVTGFGQTGPYRERPGYDFMAQGMGGLMSISGEPDDVPGGGPMRAGVPVIDIFAGMYATIAICAAVAHCARDGHADSTWMSRCSIPAWRCSPIRARPISPPGENPGAHRQHAPDHRALPGVPHRRRRDDPRLRQRQPVRQVLRRRRGCEALAQDPRFAKNGDRVSNREPAGAACSRRSSRSGPRRTG